MKIVNNNASRLCKCRSCGSILEVNPSDLKSESCSGRDDDCIATRYYFVCPCCNAKNEVRLQRFYPIKSRT